MKLNKSGFRPPLCTYRLNWARRTSWGWWDAYNVPCAEDVGLPTKFRLNVGPASQPIAGSMPVNLLRRWPNTNPSLGLLYRPTLRKHVAFTQCCFNVDPQSSPLAWHWNSIDVVTCFPKLHCYAGDTFHPGARKTDHTIHWPNADVMLGHRLRRWANIIPTKTL